MNLAGLPIRVSRYWNQNACDPGIDTFWYKTCPVFSSGIFEKERKKGSLKVEGHCVHCTDSGSPRQVRMRFSRELLDQFLI
jgi:hypothetical protein